MAFRHSSRYVFIFLAIAVVLSYAYYEARGYIHGPQLTITAPVDGFSVTQEELTVEGTAKNINSITLNGRAIFVDEAGHFKETVMLSSGYNVITLAVADRYERTNTKYARGMYISPDVDIRVPKTFVDTSTDSLKDANDEDDTDIVATSSTSSVEEVNAGSTLQPITAL
jgi:hypothetical protein